MLTVHIGPHKTATSYLQENFRATRAELEAQGCTYPEALAGTDSAHHHIAYNPDAYLDASGKHHGDLAALAKAGHKHILLSSEAFRTWEIGQFEALMRNLGESRINIVYAVRDPISTFESFWAEEVKQGSIFGLSERFAANFGDPLASRLLNPLVELEPLLNAPWARLQIIPFDVLRARKMDIYAHFTSAVLGLGELAPKTTRPVNVSYPVQLTEFLRAMTILSAGGKRRIGSELRIKFISKTTPAERDRIVALMRTEARPARRAVNFAARVSWKTELEGLLRARLADVWTLDPGDTPLFVNEEQTYIYYNEHQLLSLPAIRGVIDDIMGRLAAA